MCRELQGRRFKVPRRSHHLSVHLAIFLQIIMQVDWFQVLDIDIADCIFAQVPHFVERIEHCVVLLRTVDHLYGEILALIDPVVAQIDGNNDKRLTSLRI